MSPPEAFRRGQRVLPKLDAAGRVDWALQHLPGGHLLSSSFGAQSAVMLHLVTRIEPDIPVVFIDTGYHFAETYRFVEQLVERLDLNLKVYRAGVSAAWQEARHGQRWVKGPAGIAAYNAENKVEPMQRALSELKCRTWLAGLRRSQSRSRETLAVIGRQDDRIKLHPIFDWTDRDVHDYLKLHDLPYHPLWHQGYISIGDWHTTRSLSEVDEADETRFFGLMRECGLHVQSG
jgi:phosphoadenosine phosphosulfate reductase